MRASASSVLAAHTRAVGTVSFMAVPPPDPLAGTAAPGRARWWAPVDRFDHRIEAGLALHRHRPWLSRSTWMASRIGDAVPVVALALLLATRRRQALPLVAAATFNAVAVNYVVKPLVDRPRPNGLGRTSSCPSGHTATAVAVAALAPRAPLAAMFTAAAATGAARVGSGVHWVTDVVAGAAVGAAAGGGLRLLLRRMQQF